MMSIRKSVGKLVSSLLSPLSSLLSPPPPPHSSLHPHKTVRSFDLKPYQEPPTMPSNKISSLLSRFEKIGSSESQCDALRIASSRSPCGSASGSPITSPTVSPTHSLKKSDQLASEETMGNNTSNEVRRTSETPLLSISRHMSSMKTAWYDNDDSGDDSSDDGGFNIRDSICQPAKTTSRGGRRPQNSS
jgi:hypothetical protein